MHIIVMVTQTNRPYSCIRKRGFDLGLFNFSIKTVQFATVIKFNHNKSISRVLYSSDISKLSYWIVFLFKPVGVSITMLASLSMCYFYQSYWTIVSLSNVWLFLFAVATCLCWSHFGCLVAPVEYKYNSTSVINSSSKTDRPPRRHRHSEGRGKNILVLTKVQAAPRTCNNTHLHTHHDPDSKVHGAYLGPTGPRLAPCWPH